MDVKFSLYTFSTLLHFDPKTICLSLSHLEQKILFISPSLIHLSLKFPFTNCKKKKFNSINLDETFIKITRCLVLYSPLTLASGPHSPRWLIRSAKFLLNCLSWPLHDSSSSSLLSSQRRQPFFLHEREIFRIKISLKLN